MAEIVNIDHETGDFTQYTSTALGGGDLSVKKVAQLAGSWGLSVLVNGSGNINARKVFTTITNNIYRTSFRYDPNARGAGATDLIHSMQDSSVVRRIEIWTDVNGGNQRIHLRVDNDSGQLIGPWVVISDSPHIVEYRIKYATGASANNGEATLWIDGIQVWTDTTLDLFNISKPARVSLGHISGATTPTRTYYLDDLIVRDDDVVINPLKSTEGVTIAMTQFGAIIVTGNQSITIPSLGGLTPKAAIFIQCETTVNSQVSTDLHFGIGMCDAVNQWACAIASDDSNTPSNDGSRGMKDKCAMVLDDSGNSVLGEAGFVSFDPGGITINWSNAVNTAILFHLIVLTGDDLSAYVGNVLGTAKDVEADVTAPGFRPDLLLTAAPGRKFDDTSGSSGEFSFGVVHDKSGIVTQRSLSIRSTGSSNPANIVGLASTLYGLTNLSSSALVYGLEFLNFDNNGFSVTPRLATAINEEFGYIALKFGSSYKTKILDMDSSNVTGDKAYTGYGFLPQFVGMLAGRYLAYDTVYTDNKGSEIVLSAFDKDDSYSSATNSQDGVIPTDTQGLSDKMAVHLMSQFGNDDLIKAEYTSMDADGFTIDYVISDGTTRKWFSFAVSELIESENLQSNLIGNLKGNLAGGLR